MKYVKFKIQIAEPETQLLLRAQAIVLIVGKNLKTDCYWLLEERFFFFFLKADKNLLSNVELKAQNVFGLQKN